MTTSCRVRSLTDLPWSVAAKNTATSFTLLRNKYGLFGREWPDNPDEVALARAGSGQESHTDPGSGSASTSASCFSCCIRCKTARAAKGMAPAAAFGSTGAVVKEISTAGAGG